MDPRYKELCYVICDYNDIELDEYDNKYNYFGTWAMVHFGDISVPEYQYIQELLKETWDLKSGKITIDKIVCNDDVHCELVKRIMDAYKLFRKGLRPFTIYYL